ncbi:class I tRNA ligase family protein [Mesomycoplasma hyopneumoniae]|uniref:Cysteine--tRNA ligase n=2 Tax=Mesomycoplasma hyopneumoniae TaxID=2099 RepID=SYC_MESH2|nr:class I tRNA ligase family protein [Mesomycoplasma hyopneumoniae]Q5ZZP6.1 RecName: Full=Cysteine--tRNA ligase; AltName: Full=Cysteinyl-tRNA synthetase; Short=CysRS [Mesomycoplasma hyopneumoniae 232]AAV28016.1 cysteinyl-tRNA synthetase [Mesomycoplasma hyopneumoniae 232]MXR12678.1 cysteine--tRNA ligase [Mesomycoplasma hyopneumoniae]OWG16226.1 cysteine--tRNA ligase [Mesomycoplasma hyopneumoniae]QLG43712.1 class I tRNA ligase family protein [Mesomycoplasma hyopneumoniae]VEU65610.1 Cysteine--tR
MNLINKKNLNIYLCGPTVYSDVHIGNLRTIIIFDAIFECLKNKGFSINFLHNITDIDDKIIEKAQELGISEAELTEKYTNEYFKILEIFNIKKPTKIVKVTEKIEKIIEYIKLLEKKGFTYYNKNNDLVFDILKIPNYGIISGQKIESLLDKNTKKTKSKNDFVLWKKTQKGLFFKSFFGLGRPGWHTECAALIYDYFQKKSLDLHGGGVDLIFPHHENENAQHFALTGNPIAENWFRSGFVNLNGKKMAKSLNNVLLAKDFSHKYNPDIIRSIFLSINPTVPINLTEELIKNHKKLIEKYQKICFEWYFDKKNEKTEKVEQVLNLFIEGKFAKANFLIMELIKQKENSTIRKIFLNLRFNFTKMHLNPESQEKIKNWNKLIMDKNYSEADKIRKELWKIFKNS